jgi:hypothetical protein
MNSKDDLPFEGVKVLDLSQGVAGPYCAMHLARNGADVIKVEPTGTGCWSRRLGKHTGDHTAHSVIVNRAKRSLAVDLKTGQGVAIVQRLAAESDVVPAKLSRRQDRQVQARLRERQKIQPECYLPLHFRLRREGPALRSTGNRLGDAGLYGDDVDQPQCGGRPAAY